jgi:hypothetical protein
MADIHPARAIASAGSSGQNPTAAYPERIPTTSSAGGTTTSADGTVLDDTAIRARQVERDRARAERMRQLEEQGAANGGADANGAANGGGNGNGAGRPAARLGGQRGGNGASNN